MLLLTARDITAAPHHHHPTEKVLSDVILLRTARDITAVPNNQYTHHPVMLLLSAFATGVITAESVVHQRHHHHHHLVSSVRLVAWVPIAARVIPILSAHLRAESIVVYHPHHHPVSFVLLVVVESIVVLVIPILCAPAVIPVTTVAPEKNVTKSVNSSAVGVKVARVAKVAREDTMAAALVDTTVAAALVAMVAMEVKVEKEERVARVATTVDTKFVNSSVNWFTRSKLSFNEKENVACGRLFISSIRVEQTLLYNISLNEMPFNNKSTNEQMNTNDFLQHTYIFIASTSADIWITSIYINFPHDALYVAGRLLVSLFIFLCTVCDMVGVPFLYECTVYPICLCHPPYMPIYMFICFVTVPIIIVH